MKTLKAVLKYVGKIKAVLAYIQAIDAGLDAFKNSLEKSNILENEKE